MRALPASAFTLALAIGAIGAISGGVSSAAASGPGVIETTFSGDHNYTEILTQLNGTVNETVSVHWTLSISGSNKTIQAGRDEPYFNLEGTVSQSGNGISCSGHLSPAAVPRGELNNLFSIEPPGDRAIAAHFMSGLGPQNNARSKEYLLEGSLPGIVHPNDIVSDNKNPAQSGCNTGGLTYYYAPMAGSSNYQAWQKVLAPVVSLNVGAKGSEESKAVDFAWSGSVNAPPGDTIMVTEKDSETFTLERVDHPFPKR